MKDKFCVSKSLTYLVALVVAVVGAYYVMNYVNKTNVSTNTEAGSKCRTETGVTGMWRKSACPAGYTEYTGPGGTYTYGPGGALTMYCCLSNFSDDDARNPGGTNYGTKAEVSAAITAADCTSKKNTIAEKIGLRCKYYTGNYKVSKGRVSCDVKVSDDFIACSGAVGSALQVKGDVLKATCAGVKGNIVPDSVELGASTGHYVCRVFTGGYRTSTNPADVADLTTMCLTAYARDMNVGTVATPLYNTNNCH